MTDPTKQRIQELVPEVMKLKFGCGIRWEPTERERRDDPEVGNRHFTVYRTDTQWGDIHQTQTPIFTLIETYFAETRIEQVPKEKLLSDLRYKILGSPITLAVVLRAIAKTLHDIHPIYFVSESGMLWKEDLDENGKYQTTSIYAQWNLAKDNYDNQTEETKLFIGTLLGV